MATACSDAGPQAGAGGDTLYIAVAAARGPTTEAYFNGVAMAVDELNAARRPNEPPFGMLLPPEDQPSQVAVAAAFRDDPAVIGVVGHTGSGQTLEAAPIYADVEHGGERAVVAISPTATNPLVTRASAWVFRVCPTDIDAARALARYAADSLDSRRAAVIYRNDLFGRGFTRTFEPEFESGGGAVVERDPYLADITEFEAYATRIVRRRADALVIAGGAADAATVVRMLQELGGRMPILGSDDLASLAADPQTAREFRGVRYTAFYLADRAITDRGERFAREYRLRYGMQPEHRAALSYDAALIIGTAASIVGPDRNRIREWIERLGNGHDRFEGATGPIGFDSWGDPIDKPVQIAEVGS